MNASAELRTLHDAIKHLPRRSVVERRTVSGERLIATVPAWPDDDGRATIHMIVGPDASVEAATGMLIAFAADVERATIVRFERCPFSLEDGVRKILAVSADDARAMVGGAIPLPGPVTLFDVPLPSSDARQLLLAREIAPSQDGHVTYRIREIEFIGRSVMPMPIEIEFDLSGPVHADDDASPAFVRNLIDPLGAAPTIQGMLPHAGHMTDLECRDAMTSYANLLTYLLVEMDSPTTDITRSDDGIIHVEEWSPAHG